MRKSFVNHVNTVSAAARTVPAGINANFFLVHLRILLQPLPRRILPGDNEIQTVVRRLARLLSRVLRARLDREPVHECL